MAKEKSDTLRKENCNHWCVFTGRSIIHPHPHRHYTLIEFAFCIGNKKDLYEKFFKDNLFNLHD